MPKRKNNPLTLSLLDWYQKNGRDLPWRTKGGAADDAYLVWISEIMLQQTTVATVYDYFNRWMKRFPDIKTLASSDLEDVLKMWQGLGYYTRAKKIYECAKVLMEKYDGVFPNSREELLKLPGIGPYTASSICAFAFNLPETVVDGNVIRVIARLYGITDEINKNDIYERACQLTSQTEGADYASAIMDLGATVCKPQNPLCDLCPWQSDCIAYKKKIYNDIPKISKPQKKKSKGSIFIAFDPKDRVFILKRDTGLLSGLWEFPWNLEGFCPPFPADWIKQKHTVRHIFTHIDFTGDIYIAKQNKTDENFVPLDKLSDYPMSKLMLKVKKLTFK